MILGCLITIITFVFTLFILLITGTMVTLGLLLKLLLPFILIFAGIYIIVKKII